MSHASDASKDGMQPSEKPAVPDEDIRSKELFFEQHAEVAFLKDYRESLRLFIESITNFPVTISLGGSREITLVDRSATATTCEVTLPNATVYFDDHEQNRQTFVLLAGVHAAAYRYATGFEQKQLVAIVQKAHRDGSKQFKKDNPVRLPTHFITGITRDDFAGHFEHPDIIHNLFSSLELGRVMSCLYRDYAPTLAWYRELLQVFYLHS